MGKTELAVKPLRTFEDCAECYEAFQAEKWLSSIVNGEAVRFNHWEVGETDDASLLAWMKARKEQAAERIRVIEWLRDLNANGRKSK